MRQRSGSRMRIRKLRPGRHGNRSGYLFRRKERSPDSIINLGVNISKNHGGCSKLLQGGEKVALQDAVAGSVLDILPGSYS
jgi:hypothetical protein